MPLTEQIAAYWSRVPCGSRHPDPTTQRYFTQPHIPPFADFSKWKGKSVVEIGCGIGTDTLEFLKAGVRVIYAVDISTRSIALASQRAYRLTLNTAYFIPANAEEFLPRGPFDLIWSFGVLHHTPHPEKVLTLARERLVPDGELRIMLYAKWSWKHLFTRQQPEAQAGCPLVKWYSMKAARHLIESCGFQVTSIHKTHIFPWRIVGYVEHRYVKAFPWNIVPRWMFQWLESKLGHHLLVVALCSPKTPTIPSVSRLTPRSATGSTNSGGAHG